MAKKKTEQIRFERMNEVFHLKLYKDGTLDLVDLEDGETINTTAEKLPAVKALIADLEKFQKEGK